MKKRTTRKPVCLIYDGSQKAMNTWQLYHTEYNGHTYRIELVAFDEPSEYGINNGRISKLGIREDGRVVVNYDRGWDIKPDTDTDARAVYDAVLQVINNNNPM